MVFTSLAGMEVRCILRCNHEVGFVSMCAKMCVAEAPSNPRPFASAAPSGEAQLATC